MKKDFVYFVVCKEKPNKDNLFATFTPNFSFVVKDLSYISTVFFDLSGGREMSDFTITIDSMDFYF